MAEHDCMPAPAARLDIGAAAVPVDNLDHIAAAVIGEVAALRAALARHGNSGTADELARRLCQSVAGLAFNAAVLAEAAGVRFYVERYAAGIKPCSLRVLPGLSLPLALAALLEGRAAGEDVSVFSSLGDGGAA